MNVMEIMSKDLVAIIETAKANLKTLMNTYNVQGYGAKGDGVTDDTAAIQQALNDAANGGGTVFFPAGIYRTSATLKVKPGVRVTGAATSRIPLNLIVEQVTGTLIKPLSNYGDVFLFDKAANWAGIENLSIHYPGITPQSTSTPSTFAAIKFTIATIDAEYTDFTAVKNVDILGMGQGIVMPWVKGTSLNYAQYYYNVFENISISRCNVGVFINGCSDIRIDNVYCKDLFGGSLPSINANIAPIANDVNLSSPTYAGVAQNLINDLGNSVVTKFEVYGGPGDGMVLQDCIAISYNEGTCASLAANGLVMVGCTNQCRINGLRSALNGQNGVEIKTSKNHTYDINFTNCRIENNYWSGVHGIPDTNMRIWRLTFTGCHVTNNGLAAANTYHGIDLNASYLNFVACQLNDTQTTRTQRTGAQGNYAGVDYWNFDQCDFTGNLALPIIAGNHVEFRACQGVNGLQFGLTTPAVPAAGLAAAVTNTNIVEARIYCTGPAGMDPHIIDQGGADRLVYGNQFNLKRGEKIYFATTVPSAWVWYGV